MRLLDLGSTFERRQAITDLLPLVLGTEVLLAQFANRGQRLVLFSHCVSCVSLNRTVCVRRMTADEGRFSFEELSLGFLQLYLKRVIAFTCTGTGDDIPREMEETVCFALFSSLSVCLTLIG